MESTDNFSYSYAGLLDGSGVRVTDVTSGFGATLQRRREQLGWTQEKLAAEAALSAEAVSALERGTRRFPQKQTIERLVDALGLTGADLAEFLATVPRAVRRRAGGLATVAGAHDVSRPIVPRQLPAAIADFIGRTEHLRQLTELLAQPLTGRGPIVAALTGMGGVGKTALAVQVAYAVADCYPDGQLYLDLRGYGPDDPLTAIDALGYLLRALGTPSDGIPLEVPEAAAKFRSAVAARRSLIVLDNARDGGQVQPMLPGTSECAVIVTSRRLLSALPNTRHIRLRSLHETDGVQMLRTLAGEARIGDGATAAGEVVRLCGSLPLAIRMAGARLAARPEWPISYLAQRLQDERGRLDELTRDDISVRTSFAVSIDQLAGSTDPSDQHAAETFVLLGVPDVPDISLLVASRLVRRSERETERTLERLVDLNLVEAPTPGRYRLHDLLRVYARERAADILSESDRAAALTRVIDLYVAAAWRTLSLVQPRTHRLSLADKSWTEGSPRLDDVGAAVSWLDRERRHLVAIIRQGISTAAVSDDLVVQLALGLFGYYATTRHWLDWAQVTGAPIEAGISARNRRAMSVLRNDLGLALARLAEGGSGSYDDAVTQLQRSLADIQTIGDRVRESMCTANLTLVLDLAGRLSEAIEYGERSRDLARELGDINGQAIAIGNLGRVYGRAGDRDRQVACLRESLELLERVGGDQQQAEVLEMLAATYGESGQTDEAIASLEQSARLYERAGDPLGAAGALNELGTLHIQLGNHFEALTKLEEGLATAEQHDDNRREASILRQMGVTLEALGRHREAEERFLAALVIYNGHNMAASEDVRVLLERLQAGGS